MCASPAQHRRAGAGVGDEAKLRARVRGLLNRLAEFNLPGIAADLARLMEQGGRLAVTQAMVDELLSVSAAAKRRCSQWWRHLSVRSLILRGELSPCRPVRLSPGVLPACGSRAR